MADAAIAAELIVNLNASSREIVHSVVMNDAAEPILFNEHAIHLQFPGFSYSG